MISLYPLFLLCCATVAHALVSSPTRPPSYPLAVRSPYLSTWIKGSHDGIQDQSPEFWNGQPLGWTGLVRINGTVYSLFGARPIEIESHKTMQISQNFTPSSSSFKFDVVGVIFELTFSNPLTPQDYKRQTLPLSYLEVNISSFHQYESLDLYFDINGAWCSGDQNEFISWDTQTQSSGSPKSSIVSQVIHRTNELMFTEIDDMAEWGSIFWSTDDDHHMTYSSGYPAASSRKRFARRGNLSNVVDDAHRPTNSDEPVFAFSKHFDAAESHQSALYTIGLVQEQVLQVNITKEGYKIARPLYRRYFDSITDMVLWHYKDHRHVYHDTFSNEILKDSRAIDENYATITALSAVQAIGGTQLVINDADPHGEPHLWMKEISSDGNMQTSDVMYPAFPFFMYANYKLGVAMLEPLLIHQEAGLYPNKYAMHDMGSSYPNATGHADGNDEYMPVEECGNNLIMMLSTHDAWVAAAVSENETRSAHDWLTSHHDIALQWTQYLIDYGLVPELQLSTDDFAGRLANQTNLAIKAIVGIKCMSVIAQITGHTKESQQLEEIVQDYVNAWLSLAYESSIPVAKLAYQWKGSWGSLYNLYADALLDLQIFPRIVYDQQDSWYLRMLEPYGLPLDSRHLYTKSDWQVFIASFSTPALYTQLYERMSTWMNKTETQKPLIDLYDTIDGRNAVNMFTNRPVVGGHFAHLARNKMNEGRSTIQASRNPASKSDDSSNVRLRQRLFPSTTTTHHIEHKGL